MEQIIGMIKSIWRIIVALKWFWFILFIIFLIKASPYIISYIIHKIRKRRHFRQGEEWRSDRQLLEWLRSMKPNDFEEYVADLFRRMGYKTEVRGGPYDKGVDVVAEKDGIKHYIQCKKYFKWHQVGVAEVREFYGSMAHFLVNAKGIFITTSKFTIEAERFAEDKPIELIDGFRLIDYIRQVEKQKK